MNNEMMLAWSDLPEESDENGVEPRNERISGTAKDTALPVIISPSVDAPPHDEDAAAAPVIAEGYLRVIMSGSLSRYA